MEEVDMQTERESSRPVSRIAPHPRPPAPPPEPAAPPRHPHRDEAVKAFRDGIPIAEIIETLELTVTADAIRDWDAEDRLAAKLSNKGGISNDHTSRYTEEQKRAAVDRVLAGENPHSIAEELGCSTRLLRIWCDARIKTNKEEKLRASESVASKGNCIGPRSRFTEAEQRDACERVARGYDIADVAEQMQIDRSTIRNWARALKINIATRPYAQHSDEFKQAAVSRVLDKGESCNGVASELGLADTTVAYWIKLERERRATLEKVMATPAADKPVPSTQSRARLGRKGGQGGSLSAFTDAQRQAAVQRWIDGGDKEAIAAELGVNSQTLRNWGYDFDMALPTQRRYREDHPKRVDAVRRMIEEGVEPEVIAQEFDFDPDTARRWRREELQRRRDLEVAEMRSAYEAKKAAERAAAAAPPAPAPVPEPPKVEVAAPPPPPPVVQAVVEKLDAVIVETRVAPAAPQPNGKIKIDISDPHTRRVWETALAAAVEEQQRVLGLQNQPVGGFIPSPSWERPKPPAPPTPVVPAAPRKARAVQMLQCPECNGQFAAPPPLAGGFEITQGRCPHCKVVIEL